MLDIIFSKASLYTYIFVVVIWTIINRNATSHYKTGSFFILTPVINVISFFLFLVALLIDSFGPLDNFIQGKNK